MIYLKNFKSYTPAKGNDELEILRLAGALFLQSEDGVDWYSCQKEFKQDSFKIQLNSDLKVTAVTKDVSSIYPKNCSVVEVLELPATDATIYDYTYSEEDKILVLTPEVKYLKVKKDIQNKMAEALTFIKPYQYAIDLDIQTKEDEDLLNIYKKYIVELNRLYSQEKYPEIIDWPTLGVKTT